MVSSFRSPDEEPQRTINTVGNCVTHVCFLKNIIGVYMGFNHIALSFRCLLCSLLETGPVVLRAIKSNFCQLQRDWSGPVFTLLQQQEYFNCVQTRREIYVQLVTFEHNRSSSFFNKRRQNFQMQEWMLAVYVSENQTYVETSHFCMLQIFLMLWQYCAYSLVRFRHKIYLVRVRKLSCFSLKKQNNLN